MSTFKNLIFINAILALTLLIGFANNILIASYFGLSELLDAYFAAIVLPSLLMSLFVDFVGKNFLPLYSEARSESMQSASELASSVINIVAVVALVLTLVVILFSQLIFSIILPGFSADQLEVVTDMFLIMSPVIFFMAVSSFYEYLHQYNKHYIRMTAYRMLLPVSVMVCVLTMSPYIKEYALPVGFLLGRVLSFLALLIGAGYTYQLRFRTDCHRLQSIFVSSGILITSGLIARIRPAIERYYASTLDVGAISGLSLANKLCIPIQQSGMYGLKLITFSKSSRLASDNKLDEIGLLYERAVMTMLLLLIPLVVWIGINSYAIVEVVFVRGEFDKQMADVVSRAMVGLVPSIAFLSIGQIVTNAFYSLNKIALPAILGPVTTVLYVICIMLLIDDYGVFGLALSVSIISLAAFLVSVTVLSRELETFSSRLIFRKLLFYTLAAFTSMYASMFVVDVLVQEDNILMLVLSLTFGGFLYVSSLWVIKEQGFMYLLSKVLGR